MKIENVVYLHPYSFLSLDLNLLYKYTIIILKTYYWSVKQSYLYTDLKVILILKLIDMNKSEKNQELYFSLWQLTY